MYNMLTIASYEYRIQLKRIAAWGILITAVAIALIDNFPSTGNIARLEFLSQPNYFIYRTMSLDGSVMVFGLMFLLSNRISIDLKTGVKSLMMASPITKGQYVFGKLLGSFLLTYTLLALFLILNIMAYYVAIPSDISIMDCIVPLAKTLVISGLPVSMFIGFISVCLPAVIDIRLFYLLTSVLFIINAASVSSAGQMSFYLITSGDLMKLIWQNPKWPFINTGSIQANLIFIVGCGILSCAMLLMKRKFWRAE